MFKLFWSLNSLRTLHSHYKISEKPFLLTPIPIIAILTKRLKPLQEWTFFAYFTERFLIRLTCQIKSVIYFRVNQQHWAKKTEGPIEKRSPLYLHSQPTTKTLTVPDGKCHRVAQITHVIIITQIIISNWHTLPVLQSFHSARFCYLIAKGKVFPNDFTATENIYKSV